MSATTAPRFLLHQRGTVRELEAFVVACAFDRSGTQAAFALGDGTVQLVSLADRTAWRAVAAHDGATLAFAADCRPTGFVSGGDDGAFRRVAADGGVTDLARFGMKWVEHVTSAPPEGGKTAGGKTAGGKADRGKPGGLLACSVGKQAVLFDAAGTKLKALDHPSSVTGLTFDTRGKRVAASHYNGASLWFVASKTDSPRRLEWKGSHTGVAVSPDGDNVVTAMQENALHGWRLSDMQHMRMSGYPSKTASLEFTRGGKWLASSGAESVVLWPFSGSGPMGKAPTELAGGDAGVLCTRIAAHPAREVIAAGFSDGLVVVADIGTSRIAAIAPPGKGPVSGLAWSPDGAQLAFGTETGFAGLVDLSGG